MRLRLGDGRDRPEDRAGAGRRCAQSDSRPAAASISRFFAGHGHSGPVQYVPTRGRGREGHAHLGNPADELTAPPSLLVTREIVSLSRGDKAVRSSHPEPRSRRECGSHGGAQRSGMAGRESEGKGPATPEAQFFDAPDLERPQSTHAIAYYDWGRRHNPRVLLCVHGLTRNGNDFGVLRTRCRTSTASFAPIYRGVVAATGSRRRVIIPIPSTWPISTRCWTTLALTAWTGSAPPWAASSA